MANIFEYLCELVEADYKASGLWLKTQQDRVFCGTTLNLGPFVAGAGESCHSTRDDQDSTSMSNKATRSLNCRGVFETFSDVASLSRLMKCK